MAIPTGIKRPRELVVWVRVALCRATAHYKLVTGAKLRIIVF